jgi:hypothetical protein
MLIGNDLKLLRLASWLRSILVPRGILQVDFFGLFVARCRIRNADYLIAETGARF